MAVSEEEWIRKRAYALWEEEGYPSGKDREHWERAKLEYATLDPTASTRPPAAAPGKRSATAVKAPKAPKVPASKAPKTVAKTAASEPAASKSAAPKIASSKTASKSPAAIPAAVDPAKKRSRKVPAGE